MLLTAVVKQNHFAFGKYMYLTKRLEDNRIKLLVDIC